MPSPRLTPGEPVDPVAIYFRCVPRFEVSSPALGGLTESAFIGTGALPRSSRAGVLPRRLNATADRESPPAKAR